MTREEDLTTPEEERPPRDNEPSEEEQEGANPVNVELVGGTADDALSRFWARVERTDGCWPWLGFRLASGYGTFPDRQKGRAVLAHRFSYEAVIGPIPEGLTIDHLCRNRSCVNPAHLEAVTSAENSRRGSRAKLTHADAAAIRSLPGTNVAVAKRFGVNASTVSRIRHDLRWAPTTTRGAA